MTNDDADDYVRDSLASWISVTRNEISHNDQEYADECSNVLLLRPGLETEGCLYLWYQGCSIKVNQLPSEMINSSADLIKSETSLISYKLDIVNYF